jgi:hypothetical protein
MRSSKPKPKALPVRKVTRKGKAAKPGWRENVAERVRQAVEFRKAGASFRVIGKQLGVSAMQAHRDVIGALKETLSETAESVAAYRQLEVERLDELLLFVWPQARKGDCESVRACVRIAERRARLLGLDVAVQAKLELVGKLQLPENPLANLPNEQLQARLATAMAVLEAANNPVPLPPKPPEPVLSPEAQYAQVLAARRAEGNGG